jgi:acyl carrier protein
MNNDIIEEIIKRSFSKFNLVSSKDLKINNIKKFKLNKKFDSLAIINLVMAFENEIKNEKIINVLRKKPINNVFKSYASIKKFLKKYDN